MGRSTAGSTAASRGGQGHTDGVVITGRVVESLSPEARDRAIEVREQAVCAPGRVVATTRPKPDGSFKVTVPGRPDQAGAV